MDSRLEPARRHTLHAASAPVDRLLIGPGLIAGLFALVAGLLLPTLTVETFPLISDSVSIMGGLAVLWGDDQYFLFVVLLVFSVLFPAAKYALGLWIWFAADTGTKRPVLMVGWLDELAKWSMLDVLVVAIVVAALNLTVISGVFVHAGLYLFTLSVVLSRLLVGRIDRLMRRPIR